MARKVVFSGIQPTGEIHLGNYLGALRNWVRLQDEHDAVYCVVDLHALTSPQDPPAFLRERLDAARVLLAVGVDPTRSLVYYQSRVPQHTELAWILGTLTQTGVLNRMTQFKEKADRKGANLGLYAYPVLMAADILLFHAEAVPVGEDQTQHLELARDLAERFNNRFGEEFPIPEAIIPEKGARVMSLTDPSVKMSKSDPDPDSRILVLDSPDTIRHKMSRAVTDSGREITYDWEKKPGVSNLLEILSLFSGTPVEDLVTGFEGRLYRDLKEAVTEAIIAGLAPIRSNYASFDDREVERILQAGALDARTRAEGLQARVRRRVGLS